MDKKPLTRKQKMLNFFIMVLNYLTLFIPALLKKWIANIKVKQNIDEAEKAKLDTKERVKKFKNGKKNKK